MPFQFEWRWYSTAMKTQKFLDRNNFSEVINYRGNVVDSVGSTNYPQMFYTLDVDDVLNENFVPEMIKDKIVIFGFLGESLGAIHPGLINSIHRLIKNLLARQIPICLVR